MNFPSRVTVKWVAISNKYYDQSELKNKETTQHKKGRNKKKIEGFTKYLQLVERKHLSSQNIIEIYGFFSLPEQCFQVCLAYAAFKMAFGCFTRFYNQAQEELLLVLEVLQFLPLFSFSFVKGEFEKEKAVTRIKRLTLSKDTVY